MIHLLAEYDVFGLLGEAIFTRVDILEGTLAALLPVGGFLTHALYFHQMNRIIVS